ncbi:hypothetical protein TrVE_jg8871 [Triparma verrucosa]|uniref:Bromo domain-containing protein n=1 Tax=Triparma verrucosa TaxID=1606542 RepID=A0A9W7F270_9STRA|nr:hypothetical protein TrVE_jg8871 [Triparma verrucosa]
MSTSSTAIPMDVDPPSLPSSSSIHASVPSSSSSSSSTTLAGPQNPPPPPPPPSAPSLHSQLSSLLNEYNTLAKLRGEPPPTFENHLPLGPLNADLRYTHLQSDLRSTFENHPETLRGSTLSLSDFLLPPSPLPGLMLNPRQPSLSVSSLGLSSSRSQITSCPLLSRGKTSHLTPRENYDIYLENVAATLQSNLISSSETVESKTVGLTEVEAALKQQALETRRISSEKTRIITTLETETTSETLPVLDTRAREVLEEMKSKAVMYEKGEFTDKDMVEEVAALIDIVIEKLWSWSYSGLNPFRQSIDSTFLTSFPSYSSIISKPISLPLLRSNNASRLYINVQSFVRDLQLMLENCVVFNKEGVYVEAAKKLGEEVRGWIKECKKGEKRVVKKYKKGKGENV